MYLSILALPFFGSAVAGLLGRKIGVTGAHIITTGSLMITTVLAVVAFYEVGLCGSPVSSNYSHGSTQNSCTFHGDSCSTHLQ